MDERAPLRRSDALRRVAEALNETLDAEAAIAALLPELEGVLGLRTAWAFRYRPERSDFVKIAATGLPPALAANGQQALEEDSCECQRRFHAGQLDQAVNMVTCSRLRDAQGDKEGLVLHASVPLRRGEHMLGILNVAAPGTAHFDQESLALLSAVGSQFAVALGRAESHAAAAHRARQLEALADVARLMLDARDPAGILRSAVSLGAARLGIPRLAAVRRRDGQVFAFAAQDGAHPRRRAALASEEALLFPKSREQLRQAVSEEETLLAETPSAGGFDLPERAMFDALAAHLQSALAAARRQEELRESAVLKERQRIAADLHDAVSQRLFAAVLNLHAARLGAGLEPQAASQQVATAEQQLRLAQTELRTLARTLLLQAPPDIGAALQDLVSAFSVGTGPRIESRIASRLPHLAPAAAQAILRVAQEALHNALRHAGAKTVEVDLSVQRGAVVLRVRDDGTGFAEAAGTGAGLGSMRARAAAVGADILIRSRPGAGTSVRLRLPEEAREEGER